MFHAQDCECKMSHFWGSKRSVSQFLHHIQKKKIFFLNRHYILSTDVNNFCSCCSRKRVTKRYKISVTVRALHAWNANVIITLRYLRIILFYLHFWPNLTFWHHWIKHKLFYLHVCLQSPDVAAKCSYTVLFCSMYGYFDTYWGLFCSMCTDQWLTSFLTRDSCFISKQAKLLLRCVLFYLHEQASQVVVKVRFVLSPCSIKIILVS